MGRLAGTGGKERLGGGDCCWDRVEKRARGIVSWTGFEIAWGVGGGGVFPLYKWKRGDLC